MALMTVTPGVRRTTTTFGPNWFASVMGTAIVAIVLAPHLPTVALAVWVMAASLLGVLVVGVVLHERSYLDHPVQQHFYGAPAMGLMAVGAGAVITQGHEPVAVLIAAVLWVLGTTLGVVTALTVPRRTRGADLASVGPWWLMPVVPPTVSATTGALFVPLLPGGPLRAAFLLLCYALLVLSLVGSARVGRLLVLRVRQHGWGDPAMAATWLIVLGPLGQSVTAVHHLGEVGPSSTWLTLGYGVPVLTFALAWMAVAIARVWRDRPPFGLTWWSFTFPVGTVTTAASGLGVDVLAGALTGIVVGAWVVVGLGTLRGALDGSLLRG
ncbi:MAG: C4-dicarboxylate ABC transporter [Nocardioides sp.]